MLELVPAVSGATDGHDTEMAVRVYYFLSLVAVGRLDEVTSGISETDPYELQGVLKLVEYEGIRSNLKDSTTFEQNPELEAMITQIISILNDAPSPMTVFVYSLILIRHKKYSDAAKYLGPISPIHPDCCTILALVYLYLSRPDLAIMEVNKINSLGLSKIGQIVESWVNSFSGTADKARSTFYLFEELSASNIKTNNILTGSILTKIQLGEFSTAEKQIDSILSSGNFSTEILALAITVFSITGNDKKVEMAKLKLHSINPKHPLLIDIIQQEHSIDKIVREYQALMN